MRLPCHPHVRIAAEVTEYQCAYRAWPGQTCQISIVLGGKYITACYVWQLLINPEQHAGTQRA